MTAQASGVYEGIPLVPSLFANARDKTQFKKNLKWVIVTIFIPTVRLACLGFKCFSNGFRAANIPHLEFLTNCALVYHIRDTKSSVYMDDKVTKAAIDKLVRMPMILVHGA